MPFLRKLEVPRDAVLPQFLTWLNQVGATRLVLSFRVQARSTATKLLRLPHAENIDHKTLLAVTNVAVELNDYCSDWIPVDRKSWTITNSNQRAKKVVRLHRRSVYRKTYLNWVWQPKS
ncbi:MAG: hypothetical protein Kow00121_60760 [Elainellaceae cyanobacterium]